MRIHLKRIITSVLCLILIYGLMTFIFSSNHPESRDLDSNNGAHPVHDLNLENDPIKHRKRIAADQGIFNFQNDSKKRSAPQNSDLLFSQPAGSDTGGGAPISPSRGWPAFSYYKTNGSRIWPVIHDTEDRIINQLHTVPTSNSSKGEKLKKILLYFGLDGGMEPGQSRFVDHECPVNQCTLSGSSEDAPTADLVLFKDIVTSPTFRRPSSQIWLVYMLESPFHTSFFQTTGNSINWTATYRRDSTIVAPYERFSTYMNVTELPKTAPRDFTVGKTKKVAWFVSNCNARNGRGDYAAELGKHIKLDIYGSCGTLSCSRYVGAAPGEDPCSHMLKKDYKFYLAFENSNCRDYITEKLYWNALLNDVIPIVMGARREDYELSAPPQSFIHVDDFESPLHLAQYLERVDADNDLYNSYFRWRGTGQYIDTKFWCRLCAMLHEAHRTGQHSVVTDMDAYWRGPGVCVEPRDGLKWATWQNNTNNISSTIPESELYQFWTEKPSSFKRHISFDQKEKSSPAHNAVKL